MAENILESEGAQDTAYAIERVRERNEGLVQIPVATDGEASCEMVRLHAPVETLKVIWTASRYGGPPAVPSPTTLAEDTNIILLNTQIGAIVPVIDNSGRGHHWALSGIYTYAIILPAPAVANIPTGRHPWETIGASENTIPSSTFKNDILAVR